jgi:AraC-like DNA-binding protein
MSTTPHRCARAPLSCLERSGASEGADWLQAEIPVAGVSRLRAGLKQHAYARHRHDTYTIALTERGVQEFDYRGSVHRSLPGQVVVLHPDELHDGRAGTRDGFAYRSLYLDPARIHDAVRSELGTPASLPFVENPVVDDPALAEAVMASFELPLEPLGADELVHTVCLSLMRAARQRPGAARQRVISDTALARVREFLDANVTRVVAASELEAACGESRFTINANFRRRYGTSPYRYLLMRRMEQVRARLAGSASLADLAQEVGFSDQAHLTRMFRASFGMTPGAYAALCRAGRLSSTDR